MRRIFPALAVCLAAVLTYGFVSLLPVELEQVGKHVFFGASILSNMALWSESGYFDGAASSKPLLPSSWAFHGSAANLPPAGKRSFSEAPAPEPARSLMTSRETS
jgi:hypothetical protein